jgi:hypothetical protein
MPSWAILAAIVVTALTVVAVIALRRRWDMAAGAASASVEQVTAERDLARQQGAVVAEQRSREDVAKTLDDGTF